VRADGLVAPHPALVEATNILRRLELAGRLGQLEASAAVGRSPNIPTIHAGHREGLPPWPHLQDNYYVAMLSG